jgi:hypothetical protein
VCQRRPRTACVRSAAHRMPAGAIRSCVSASAHLPRPTVAPPSGAGSTATGAMRARPRRAPPHGAREVSSAWRQFLPERRVRVSGPGYNPRLGERRGGPADLSEPRAGRLHRHRTRRHLPDGRAGHRRAIVPAGCRSRVGYAASDDPRDHTSLRPHPGTQPATTRTTTHRDDRIRLHVQRRPARPHAATIASGYTSSADPHDHTAASTRLYDGGHRP